MINFHGNEVAHKRIDVCMHCTWCYGLLRENGVALHNMETAIYMLADDREKTSHHHSSSSFVILQFLMMDLFFVFFFVFLLITQRILLNEFRACGLFGIPIAQKL